MSLQYVIDAYNIINHPIFKGVRKDAASCSGSLLDFIRKNRLTGSRRNRVVLVFDGYPPAHSEEGPRGENSVCVYSRRISADEKIRKLIEESGNPRQIVVVSNDRQVQLSASLLACRFLSVEEFSAPLAKRAEAARKKEDDEAAEEKVSFKDMQRINEEMRRKWLKE